MVKNASASQRGGNSNQIQSHGYKSQKKDRPFSTHCNFSSHTIDKCYKLHGYPPRYKQKQQSKLGNQQVSATVNQISNSSQPSVEAKHSPSGNFLQTLNPSQYQQLINLLTTHLTTSSNHTKPTISSSTSYSRGICLCVSL